VKDLVTGSELRFDDRGEHELKGVPGSWHLYALGVGETSAEPIEPAIAHMTIADRATVRIARRAPGVLRALGRMTVRERPAA
jgi:hypothetical protein